MSRISTHILDQGRGLPAAGVAVVLERVDNAGVVKIGQGVTDADGRLKTLVPEGRTLAPGIYCLSFGVGAYFRQTGTASFLEVVPVQFRVDSGVPHYHIPLLLSPYAYSTYRGS